MVWPSDDSLELLSPDALAFDWYIAKLEPTLMVIKLTFTDPLSVSVFE